MDKEELNKITDHIVQYRGAIIHDSISVDAMLGAIISIYFTREDKNNEFNRKVIDDEYFSFGLKIRILEKLNFKTYDNFFKDIKRINEIRNLFAHKVPTLDKGFFKKEKDGKEKEIIYMADLHKEFGEKIKKVDEQLHNLFFHLVEERKKEPKNEK